MDWVAAFLSIVSVLLIGHKRRLGFIFTITCNIIWVIIGFQIGKPALSFNNIVMIGFNAWFWIQWGKNKGL